MTDQSEIIANLQDQMADALASIRNLERELRGLESQLERRIGNLEDDHRRLENEVITISRS